MQHCVNTSLEEMGRRVKVERQDTHIDVKVKDQRLLLRCLPQHDP